MLIDQGCMPSIYHGNLSEQDPRWYGHFPGSMVGSSSPLDHRDFLPAFAYQRNRSNIGGIVVSVMMQQLNKKHPDNYLLAMRIIWAPVALMIVCWVFIPESPWFHARRGNKEQAMKSMKVLYGGIEGFDFEEEYGIIARTIEHEKEILAEKPSFRHVFKGLNLVSDAAFINANGKRTKQYPETRAYRHDTRSLSAIRRSCHHQHLLNL